MDANIEEHESKYSNDSYTCLACGKFCGGYLSLIYNNETKAQNSQCCYAQVELTSNFVNGDYLI